MPDQLKPSRLLARLTSEIASAPTSLESDCKQAERAAYLARLGRTDEAKVVVAALHQRYDRQPQMEISIWVNLVEGLIAHFSDMDPSARDKVMRAHALSTAADLKPLRALTSAWLAHMEYSRQNFGVMVDHLRVAVQLADTQHHASRGRVALVAAQALHLAGDLAAAKVWYSRVREHTLASGDLATTSALIHNMAWLHMSLLRQSVLTGSFSVAGARHALVGAQSNRHFDALIGTSFLPRLEPMLRAQIHCLAGDVQEALLLYEEHLSTISEIGARRLQCNLLADRAWCRVQIGAMVGAQEDAEAASCSLGPDVHVDDRAATHTRLSQVFASVGELESAAKHGQLATENWRKFESMQRKILTTVPSVADFW